MKAVKRTLVLLMTLGVLAAAHASAEESVPERVGNAVKRGGEAAGRGIEKGAEAAGHGIQKGGEATIRGLKTAGNWVDRKLHVGEEKSGKASESK